MRKQIMKGLSPKGTDPDLENETKLSLKSKMKYSNYAVILAGGVGSRFWPLSRELEPKQFLCLNGRKSLLQQTISRILPLIPPENIFIVGNTLHSFEIKRQIAKFYIPEANIILEPEGKNTAPAIGLVAKFISKQNLEAIMFVLPSDHFVSNENRFLNILKQAEKIAKQDYLVTLGIPPTIPHTGYGYIKAGLPVIGYRLQVTGLKRNTQYARRTTKHKAYYIEKFVEKPDKQRAEKFFKDKRYSWNSGMFVWKVKVILEEIETYLPDLMKQLQAIKSFTNIDKKIWSKIQAISVDYGILEKSKRAAVIAAGNIGWSDLGSWPALAELLPKDENGNAIQADSIDIGSKNTAIFGNSRLIATIGLKDLIISDTKDALLICDRSRAEEVKTIVQILNQNGRCEGSVHKIVNRPWGSYTVLNEENGFKVKLIQIEPHKRLSLQLHHHRSEHWIVVEGQAEITNGKRTWQVKTNQSTFIPKNCLHRLENPTNEPLKIIEVQNGDYLEEDDIERLEDDFERNKANKAIHIVPMQYKK